MGCISVSTGIHTKHSRDLKITALKPILVQWRSWSREYICSKGRITWIDESQVVGANLMFLFFFLSLPRWNFCHENRKENVSLIKLGVRLLQEQTQRKSPVYKYSFRHLCMRAYYKKKYEAISTCIYSHYGGFMYPSNQSQVITGSRGAYFRKSQL